MKNKKPKDFLLSECVVDLPLFSEQMEGSYGLTLKLQSSEKGSLRPEYLISQILEDSDTIQEIVRVGIFEPEDVSIEQKTCGR